MIDQSLTLPLCQQVPKGVGHVKNRLLVLVVLIIILVTIITDHRAALVAPRSSVRGAGRANEP